MLLDGKAPLPGQVMTFPNLAKTFRALAEHGKDGFYKGRSKGGVMELEDLAKHASDFVEPLKYTYRGEVTIMRVFQCPPNGQGSTIAVKYGVN
ncbi:nucleophile aminohydrolase [Lactifluus volemus]|nr:nucleophile aminohydrolase [Lactifluus volemus]